MLSEKQSDEANNKTEDLTEAISVRSWLVKASEQGRRLDKVETFMWLGFAGLTSPWPCLFSCENDAFCGDPGNRHCTLLYGVRIYSCSV